MQELYNVYLAWKTLQSRKMQTVRIIVLFSVAMCLLAGTVMLEQAVERYIEYIMTEALDTRTLIGSARDLEAAEEIRNAYIGDERILDVVVSREEKQFVSFDNCAELAGQGIESGGAVCPYHKGVAAYSSYEGELREGEALIPHDFDPRIFEGSDNPLTYNMHLIDASGWIGKELQASFTCYTLDSYGNRMPTEEQKTYTLKIVGTYDNKIMGEYDNIVYVSPETMGNIYNEVMDEQILNGSGNHAAITMIAKKQADVKQLEKESGLHPIVNGREESRFYAFFISGLKAGAVFLFIAALVNIILTTADEIRERKSEIALLRAMGYENRRIGRMLFWELLLIICMVIMIVGIVSILFVVVGNFVIHHFLGTVYQSITMQFDAAGFFKILVAGVIAMLLTFAVTYYKMEELNTAEALKEE